MKKFEVDTGGLRRDMHRAMVSLLGTGYVDSYYESAASEFIQIAEYWAAEWAKVKTRSGKKAVRRKTA